MAVYLGLYPAGDFYKHPSRGDVGTALEMCEGLRGCPAMAIREDQICFVTEPPEYVYANWEGQITDPEDRHYRLDLQGKPLNFDIRQVRWLDVEGVPPNAQAGHWAQWQLQFGAQGADRITRTAGKTSGYRTKHKGAVAGVMLAQCRWVTIRDFQRALMQSFEANARDGNTFGVLTSDDIYQPPRRRVDPNTLHKALFYCGDDRCAGYRPQSTMVTVVFTSFAVKNRYVRSRSISFPRSLGGFSSTEYEGGLLCPKCGNPLHLMNDLRVTDRIETDQVLIVEM